MSEVCELLNIKSHQIRNWEKELQLEFPRDKRNRRFFTPEDIEIIVLVEEGMDKGLSLAEIRKQLIKNGMIAEQTENAIQKMEISNLTPVEFKEIAMDLFKDIVIKREEGLKRDFEKQLKEQLDQQKQDYQEQLLQQSIHLENKIQEQIQAENQKLIIYMQESREKKKKGILGRIFGK